jgi:hypothetical protein
MKLLNNRELTRNEPELDKKNIGALIIPNNAAHFDLLALHLPTRIEARWLFFTYAKISDRHPNRPPDRHR